MKRYPEYKTSGVEWVGKIPHHWRLSRIDSLFFRRREKNTNIISDNILSVLKDRGVIRYEDKGNIGNKVSEKIENYQLVYAGDIVVNNMNVTIGSVGRSDQFGALSGIYIVLAPKRDNVDMGYYEYVFKIKPFQKSLIQISSGLMEIRESLNFIEFKTLKLPTPPFSEQTQIANFLDCKTGQIDELIRIKERQVELLHEQRTVLINQVVTKGLDPNVEMKPSEVEWIGEIPKHWTLTRLKYVSNIPVTYGLNIEADRYNTEGIRLIRITDIDESGGLRQKGVYLPEDCVPQEQMLNSYDLLLSRSGATVGKSYLHFEEGKYTSAGYLVRFNFGDYCTSKFIYYVTLSHFYRNWLEQQIIISTIQNVNGEKYSNFQLPIPLHQERKQIVAFLDSKTQQIDELITAEQRKIKLLKEYRQSLISEAVTGKIDVRSEV